MKRISIILLLMGLFSSGCNKLLPLPFSTNKQLNYSSKTFMVMGQSNAVRWGQFGGPDAFTSDIQSFAPGPITWIQCAVGGTAISQWAKGGPLYQACIQAAAGHYIDGIIWDQGEAEAEQADPAICYAWTMNFTNMINSFRADIGNPHAVVLYARLGPAQGLPNTNTERAAQEAVHIQNGVMVDLDDVPVPLGLHYLDTDYVKLSRDYANAYYAFLGGK